MNHTNNTKIIYAINNTLNHYNWIGHLDNEWSWLRTLLPDTELYIKKVKSGILIDDFGMTLTNYDAYYDKPIEESKTLSKNFMNILNLFNVNHNTKNDDLYLKVPIKDSMVGISRMEQAIIHIQDLIQYKLVNKDR